MQSCPEHSGGPGCHAPREPVTEPNLPAQVFSFKVRGAFNFLANMSKNALQGGVICASAGNHAQGVAMAARHLVRPYTLGLWYLYHMLIFYITASQARTTPA